MNSLSSSFNSYSFSAENDEIAREKCHESLENLQDNSAFVDELFGSNGYSLYLDPLMHPRNYPPAETVSWKRAFPSEIADCNSPSLAPILFPQKSILQQGALQNSWFINALAILRSQPKLLRKMFVEDTLVNRGIITVKFMKQGKWRYVIVDDLIPCTSSGKCMFASSSNANEVWIQLIEKAYAKMHGCYENLRYGNTIDALRDLTDHHVMTVPIKAAFFINLINEFNDESLFISRATPITTARDRMILRGLQVGHYYAIVSVKQIDIDATINRDAFHKKMVCIRDLWKIGEWGGVWCNSDPIWRSYPELRLLLPMDADKETFWIDIDMLLDSFTHAIIMKPPFMPLEGVLQNYYQSKSCWHRQDMFGGPPLSPRFWINPQYRLDLSERSLVLISLRQEDPLWNLAEKRFNHACIGFIVIKLDKHGRRASAINDQNVSMTSIVQSKRIEMVSFAKLLAGSYAVIPFVSNAEECLANSDLDGCASIDFTLTISSDKSSTVSSLDKLQEEQQQDKEELKEDVNAWINTIATMEDEHNIEDENASQRLLHCELASIMRQVTILRQGSSESNGIS